jgi:hypothetical protein
MAKTAAQSEYLQLPDNRWLEIRPTDDRAALKAKLQGKYPQMFSSSILSVPGAVPGMQEPQAAAARQLPKPEMHTAMTVTGEDIGPMGFKNFVSGGMSALADMARNPIGTAIGSARNMGQSVVASGISPGEMYPTMSYTANRERDEANQKMQQQALLAQGKQGEETWEQFKAHPSRTAGEIIVPQLVLEELVRGAGRVGEAVPRYAKAAEWKTIDPTRKYSPEVFDHAQRMAKSMADQLDIDPRATRSFENAVVGSGDYLFDYAERTSHPLRTPDEIAKAANDAGSEAIGYFQEQVLGRVANVDTPYGTVGQVYERLGKINDRLRPAYGSATEGKELTAVERTNLEQERDALNATLYRTASEKLGIPIEKIRELNMRGPQLKTIAEQTQSAATFRKRGMVATPQGPSIPMSGVKRTLEILKLLRGGAETTRGRMVRGIGERLSQPIEPNPAPSELEAYRRLSDVEDLAKLKEKMEKQEAQNLEAERRLAARQQKTRGQGITIEGQDFRPDVETAQRVLNERLEARKQATAAREQAKNQAQEARRIETERGLSRHGKSTVPAMTKEQFLSKYPTEEQLVKAAKETGRTVADIAEIKKALAQLRAQKIR